MHKRLLWLSMLLIAWNCVIAAEYDNTLKVDFKSTPIYYKILKSISIANHYKNYNHIPDTAYYSLPDEAKIINPNVGKYFLKFAINNESNRDYCLVFSKHYRIKLWVYGGDSLNFVQMQPKPLFFMHDYFSNELIYEIPNNYKNITCYLFIECYLPVGLGFSAQSHKYLNNKHQINILIQGVFMGILTAVVIFAILLLVRLREWVYFYYLLYLICVYLYSITVWKNINIFTGTLNISGFFPETIPFIGITISLLLYIKKFADTEQFFPLIDTIIGVFIGVRIASVFISIYFKMPILLHPLVDSFLLLPGLVVSIINARIYKHYRFNLVSFIIIYAGIIYQTFRGRLYFIPVFSANNSITNLLEWDYAFYFLGIFEAALFAAGLTEKIISIRREKDNEQKKTIELQKIALQKEMENQAIKDHMNKELEKLVFVKTQELQKANELLQIQAEEILRVNQILATHNQELTSNVEFLKMARLKDANVSYDEFKLSFPNDFTCLQFLDQLKWGNGYHCKKCNYNKYYGGKKDLSRKCKSCGYDESVTSHTLLEGIRIPLTKALYILLSYYQDQQLNITLLAKKLDMRVATCYEFIKKIEHINANKNTPKKDWIELLVQHI